MRLDQRAQRVAGQQWHIARQQDDDPALLFQEGPGLQQGVAGAELLFLDDELNIRARAERALNLVRAVPDHQRDAGGCEGISRAQDALNQREARNAVQDLGHLRLHPRALARGKHHDVNLNHE